MGAQHSSSAYVTELEDVAARAVKAHEAIAKAAERLAVAEERLADHHVAGAAYAVRGAHSYVRFALAAFQGEPS